MDSLDVRILRSYFQDRTLSPITAEFRVSSSALAKKLRENEDTVRYRLNRIQSSGFIADWRLYVNPELWGGGHVSVWFDTGSADRKREVVEALRLIPGITHAAVFYDGLVALLDFDNEESLPKRVELVRRVAGASEVFVARDAFPECRIRLTGPDWDLLRALRKDPRRTYAELAEAAGLSAPTAKARLSRMLAQGVAFAWPTINMRSPLGGVFVQLLVRYPGNRKREIDEAITARLEPYLWHVLHMLPYHPGELWPCGFNLIVPNLSIARRTLDWVACVPGVHDARLRLYEGITNFFEEYDEELDRKLGGMPTAQPRMRVKPNQRAGVPPRHG